MSYVVRPPSLPFCASFRSRFRIYEAEQLRLHGLRSFLVGVLKNLFVRMHEAVAEGKKPPEIMILDTSYLIPKIGNCAGDHSDFPKRLASLVRP